MDNSRLKDIIGNLLRDPGFVNLFFTDKQAALSGYQLSLQEQVALRKLTRPVIISVQNHYLQLEKETFSDIFTAYFPDSRETLRVRVVRETFGEEGTDLTTRKAVLHLHALVTRLAAVLPTQPRATYCPACSGAGEHVARKKTILGASTSINICKSCAGSGLVALG